MTVKALTETSVVLPLDGIWDIHVRLCGEGLPATAPTVTVTSPSGTTTTPAMTEVSGYWLGGWHTLVDVGTPGRWVAHVVHDTAGALDFTAYAGTIVPAAGMPDRDALSIYMGDHSFTDPELDDALAAEQDAQRGVCRIPAVYGADLANALLRRAQRNLFMRRLPLALPSGDGESGPQYLPGTDPEVRRLERPYRKLGIG